MRINNNQKENFINTYVNICNELIGKTEDNSYKNYYIRMADEAKNYLNFPIITNSVDLVLSNWDKLDEATIKEFVRNFQCLQG